MRRVAVRWHGDESLAQCQVLGLSEEREQDQQGDDGGLGEDGDDERAAANVAFAAALLRVAFDKAPTQRAESFFRICFRNSSRIVRHRAPPHSGCCPESSTFFCEVSPLSASVPATAGRACLPQAG